MKDYRQLAVETLAIQLQEFDYGYILWDLEDSAKSPLHNVSWESLLHKILDNKANAYMINLKDGSVLSGGGRKQPEQQELQMEEPKAQEPAAVETAKTEPVIEAKPSSPAVIKAAPTKKSSKKKHPRTGVMDYIRGALKHLRPGETGVLTKPVRYTNMRQFQPNVVMVAIKLWGAGNYHTYSDPSQPNLLFVDRKAVL